MAQSSVSTHVSGWPHSAYAGPAYRIVTPRMVVRCMNPDDVHLYHAAVQENLDHLRPWMSWAWREPLDLNTRLERLRALRSAFDQGRDFVFGLFDQAESCVLGAAGLHARLGQGVREIGYWIHSGYTRQGLATEAAAALVRVAFEVEGVSRLEIHCDPGNAPSAMVAQKLGFKLEATLRRRALREDGSLRDAMIWTMFPEDYPWSPARTWPTEAFDAIGRQVL